jgi:hypothetical protein
MEAEGLITEDVPLDPVLYHLNYRVRCLWVILFIHYFHAD